MACEPKFEVTHLGDGKLRMDGWCEGTCEHKDGCLAEFHSERKGRVNKNARITAMGHGGSIANIESLPMAISMREWSR